MKTISAIITTHAEGELILPSLFSCNLAVKNIEDKGIPVEKILVMDNPSKSTRKVVKQHAKDMNYLVTEYSFGDQGEVRNSIVKKAKGQYVAFLDGDDLWSENWLIEAHSLALNAPKDCVIYPEFNWFFEGSNNILCQIDDGDPTFDHEALRAVNLWDALCFCPKDVYLRFPFARRNIDEGFAYEDWNWNRRLFEAGVQQKIARDTIIFKRRRAGSQGAHAAKRSVVAAPTASCFYDFY